MKAQPVLPDLFVVAVDSSPSALSRVSGTDGGNGVVPSREDSGQPPFQSGSHSSWTGAQAVKACFSQRQVDVVALLKQRPMCRQELSRYSNYKINSICSVVGALLKRGLIEKTGDYDTFTDRQGHVTRRERLRVKR